MRKGFMCSNLIAQTLEICFQETSLCHWNSVKRWQLEVRCGGGQAGGGWGGCVIPLLKNNNRSSCFGTLTVCHTLSSPYKLYPQLSNWHVFIDLTVQEWGQVEGTSPQSIWSTNAFQRSSQEEKDVPFLGYRAGEVSHAPNTHLPQLCPSSTAPTI